MDLLKYNFRSALQIQKQIGLWAAEEDIVFLTGVPRSGTTRLYDVFKLAPEFHRDKGEYVETHLVNHIEKLHRYRDFNFLSTFIQDQLKGVMKTLGLPRY